jgi:hypothetical protein
MVVANFGQFLEGVTPYARHQEGKESFQYEHECKRHEKNVPHQIQSRQALGFVVFLCKLSPR